MRHDAITNLTQMIANNDLYLIAQIQHDSEERMIMNALGSTGLFDRGLNINVCSIIHKATLQSNRQSIRINVSY